MTRRDARIDSSSIPAYVARSVRRVEPIKLRTRAKSAGRQRLETESAPISTTLESSDETAEESLQTRKWFPTDFVPQLSRSSDEEEALVSFLLLYSSSRSWTFRRTEFSASKHTYFIRNCAIKHGIRRKRSIIRICILVT